MKNHQDKPVAIRISIVNDNCSISHSEWLQYNDKFKDLGIVFGISDNKYPSMVMTPYNFTCIDMAKWIAIGKESTEKEAYRRLTTCLNLQLCAHTPLPSMNNVIDVYITPQSEHYYLDKKCSNAALLIFTYPLFSLVELRDRILESFKVKAYRDGEMLLIDCGRESRDVVIGRMRRIAALCFFQMGIPADRHMINDKLISYVDDNKGFNAIYIY